MSNEFFITDEMSKITPTLKLSMDRTSTTTNASTVINQINLSRSPSAPNLETTDNPYAKIEELGGVPVIADKVNSTEEFLNTLIEALYNNPLKVNTYIICSVQTLEKLIESLTGCDKCEVVVGDFDEACGCSINSSICPVSKIWVHNGNESDVFKYKYSQYLQTFEKYRISLKLVNIKTD